MHKGRVVFGAMDEVVFGRPASEAIVEQFLRTRDHVSIDELLKRVDEKRRRLVAA